MSLFDHGGRISGGGGSPPGLRRRAYKSIFERIVTRRLQGPIVQARLAEELTIPRASVSEALRQLEREGLIVRADNRALRVKRLTLTQFVENTQVREILEGEAARLAAGRIPPAEIMAVREDVETLLTPASSPEVIWRLDDDLHNLALIYCGNPTLASVVQAVRVVVRLYGRQPFARERGPARLIVDRDEHLRVLDALEAGDGSRAGELMAAHIRSNARHKLDR